MGLTTPSGLPWPENTDPVAAGAQAIRALAEAVDAAYRTPLVVVDQVTQVNVSANAPGGTLIIDFGAYTFDGSPVLIECFWPYVARTGTTDNAPAMYVMLCDGGSANFLNRVGGIQAPASNVMAGAVTVRTRIVPPPGPHQYQLRGYRAAGTNDTWAFRAGAAGVPGTPNDAWGPVRATIRRVA